MYQNLCFSGHGAMIPSTFVVPWGFNIVFWTGPNESIDDKYAGSIEYDPVTALATNPYCIIHRPGDLCYDHLLFGYKHGGKILRIRHPAWYSRSITHFLHSGSTSLTNLIGRCLKEQENNPILKRYPTTIHWCACRNMMY